MKLKSQQMEARNLYKILLKHRNIDQLLHNVLTQKNEYDYEGYSKKKDAAFNILTKKLTKKQLFKELEKIENVDLAFTWAMTKQGHKYWHDIRDEEFKSWKNLVQLCRVQKEIQDDAS